MRHSKNTKCRYCQGSNFLQFLSLGDQPPSDSFIRKDQIRSEQRFPLDVYLCESCFLVQLLDVVYGEDIFDEYLYLASSSKALKQHYAQLAQHLSRETGLTVKDSVLDIGCNDGILLSGYSVEGVVKIGVEPSKVADHARRAGFNVIQDFFSTKVADQIVSSYGKPKIITATNVFPHVDDITEFAKGVSRAISSEGIFVIEASYLLDVIDQALFDTIYHEHLCYLSLTAVVPFLATCGLEVYDAERVNFGASGPAIRIYSQKLGGPRSVQKRLAELLDFEESWGVRLPARYLNYADKVHGVKNALKKIVSDLRSRGSRIGGFGAPAKGNTLLNFMNFGIDTIECIAENNALKQGLLTPGTHIPIVSDSEFLERNFDYALLLSWNYLDFFLKNSDFIKKGGRFIVPLPTPRIVP